MQRADLFMKGEKNMSMIKMQEMSDIEVQKYTNADSGVALFNLI